MYWAIELGEYDIIYEPRSSLKGQAVEDFIVEFTQEDSSDEQELNTDQLVDITGSSNLNPDQLTSVDEQREVLEEDKRKH